MSNYDDDDFAFSYGDIGRTSFAVRRPGKEKTFEDDFRYRLYNQEKAALRSEESPKIFREDMKVAALQLLEGNTKLQDTVNAGAFVLGLEYYQYVMSRQTDPTLYLDLFQRGLKCSDTSSGRDRERRIQPFDIIRYNRLIWNLLQGDNLVQPTSFRLKQLKTETKDIALVPDTTSSATCPPFQHETPSKDPSIEGSCTILEEELPGQISIHVVNLYKFDTLDSIIDRYCLQKKEPLPREFIRYTVQYNESRSTSSGVKTFQVHNHGSIAVQIEEETASSQNILNQSIIRIQPITQITADLSLSLDQIIRKFRQLFLEESTTVAIASAYFICFGLLLPQELFDTERFSIDLLWKSFLRNHSTPGSIEAEIKVDETNLEIKELTSQKIKLQRTDPKTPDLSKQLNDVNRRIELLIPQILTKEMFSTIRQKIVLLYQQLQSRVERHTVSSRQMSYLLSLPDTFRVTSMKETNYTLEGSFQLEGYDTFQIFDEMNVSFEIPFCSLGKFHKVLNDIVLPKEWLKDQDTEDLTFYIQTNVSKGLFSISRSNQIDPTIYTKVFLSLDKSELTTVNGKETYLSTFIVTIEAAYSVELDQVLQKFLASFQSPPLNLSVRKLFGKGEYVLAGFIFSEEIFQDYLFNDPLVREFATIDDKFTIYKERGGIKFKLGDQLNGSLHYKVIEKNTDPEAKMFPGEINVGDTVYRVSIVREARSGNISIKKVLEQKQYFDKCLLYIFNTNQSRFFSWYCHHISNISDFVHIKEVKRKQKTYYKDTKTLLREINPLLFQVGYTSPGGCDVNKLPIAITEEEANKTNFKIKFPKDTDVTDERPQFWYTCPAGNYPFPSLKINQVKIKKNKKDEEAYHKLYPFIPCCSEQSAFSGSLVDNYYNNDNNTLDSPILPDQKDTRTNKTILQEKTPIDTRRYAKLPKPVQDLLAIQLESTLLGEHQWIRIGVPLSKLGNSLLTACAMALVFQPRLRDDELRQALLLKEEELTKKLIEILPRNIHSQCGKSSQEMIFILQTQQFMNPRDWIEILQLVLEMNVVVFYFDPEEKTEKAQMYPIQYERFFLLRQPSLFPYSKTIYLYNTPSKRAYEHRHTELIVLASISDSKLSKVLQTTFSFQPKGPLSIQQAITNTRSSSPLLPTKWLKVVYQFPDAYGKIRELLFEFHYKGPLLTSSSTSNPFYARVFCSPLAPLPLLSIIPPQTVTLTQDPFLLLELLKQLKLDIYTLSDFQNQSFIGFVGVQSSVKYYALFHSQLLKTDLSTKKKLASLLTELPPYPIQQEGYSFPLHDITSQNTFFQKYSQYNREANCLLNYTYYLFSHLYHNKAEDLAAFLTDFETNHIKLLPNHQYIVDTRSFQLNNSFVKDNHLLLRSESLKERIMYNLKLQIEYNEHVLRSYHAQKYIQNYYNNAKDFTSQNEYTIYFTIQEYIKSREKEKMIYQVYSSPVALYAYYFQHPAVFEGQLCISKQVDSHSIPDIFGLQKPIWNFIGDKIVAIQFGSDEDNGFLLQTINAVPDPSSPLLLLYRQDDHKLLYYQVKPIASLPEFNFLKESS